MYQSKCRKCNRVTATVDHVCRECWLAMQSDSDVRDIRAEVIRRFSLDAISRGANVSRVIRSN